MQKEQIPIIEDDAYSDLWFDEESPPPLKSLDADGSRIAHWQHVQNFKPRLTHRLDCWLRITVIERLADIKMQMDYGSSALSQHLVAEWLANGQYSEAFRVAKAKVEGTQGFYINSSQSIF